MENRLVIVCVMYVTRTFQSGKKACMWVVVFFFVGLFCSGIQCMLIEPVHSSIQWFKRGLVPQNVCVRVKNTWGQMHLKANHFRLYNVWWFFLLDARLRFLYPPKLWWWGWLFPCLQGFWENVQPFSPRLHCVCVCMRVVFFGGVAVEISSHTLIPLCMSGLAHSGSASWDDWPNVPWQVACELVSRYVPSLCLHSSIVGPLQLPRVKGVHMFRYNLLPALLAEWPGSLMCHCSNMGVKWTPTLCIKLLKPAKLNNSNTTTCPRCVDIHIFYFSHAQNWK